MRRRKNDDSSPKSVIIDKNREREERMALTIKKSRVVYVTPPKKLSAEARKALEKTPVKREVIAKATSKKYKVV
jgi:hypothetical protein